ncbi:hypothetical protein [Streptosporangium nondiastaticum]|uniref:hypothetical protein n=1 Tax=Streptosporangium nondiastaticum TaxID=35764 RepID=UPI00167B61CE|nr:hypothetical protein [Streptosporangium nondiastaticum]
MINARPPTKACQYLNNNADFVHYDRALAAGWPIASGVIEGAARHLTGEESHPKGIGGAGSLTQPPFVP